MKIKKLCIKKYKSLWDISLELDEDLNVFVGKNNSGKSNIIDALVFLSHLIKKGEARNTYSQYGGYEEIVFGKKEKEEITFNLEFILSPDEKHSLWQELGLAISEDEFQKALNKISYLIRLNENDIMVEEVHLWYNEKDIIYAKGSHRGGVYYREILDDFKKGLMQGNWGLISHGGRSPASSILFGLPFSPGDPEEKLLLFIRHFISSFVLLAPIRRSPERQTVLGIFELNSFGENLPQVLNSLASSNRKLFEKIINSTMKIIEEIEEIKSPLKEGTQETYISIVEKSFTKEFNWKNIASGTKEALFLTTLLHTTRKGSLLMIEEPELHLHAEALWKLLSLFKKVCKEDDKQMIITTHSPMIIDFLPFEKIFIVTKENGMTKVASLREGKECETMLFQAGIPKSWLLQHKLPLFLLIVEGREDVKIWRKFLERRNVDLTKIRIVSPEDAGGGKKSIEIGKFLKKARIPIPFMIIQDSDNRKKEKEEELKKAGFTPNEYYVLSRKEIEDYLLDSKAISEITGKDIQEIEMQIKNTKGAGKEKLESLFKLLGLSKPDESMKELLAFRVEISEEISSIINRINEIISKIFEFY